MKKPNRRKKRSIKKYAMGTGNTGVVKGYMPNPSEVLRQNQIDLNNAKHQAATNPFVMGLDALGAVTTQVGMGILDKGLESWSPDSALDKALGDHAMDVDYDPSKNMPFNEAYAAMGTGPNGIQTQQVEAEGGEVMKTPDGQVTELTGPSHEEGGITGDVEEGTQFFSKRIKIGGKTPAQREKARTARLNKVSKLLEADPTDKITKETFERTKAQVEYEAESDLMVQEYAKSLDVATQDVKKFAKGGTVGDEALEFFKGFSPGDYLGLAGNMYQGISALTNASRNAAQDTPNVNYYEGFGDEALQTLEQGAGMLKGQQAASRKDILTSRNRSKGRGRAMSRGINQTRSLDLASDVQANEAMESMYNNFSQMMMDNLSKKSATQMQIGQVEAQGKTAADLANRQDRDNYATQKGVAQNAFGTAIQMAGKDLNSNKKNRILTELSGELSKYGLTFEGGKIVQNKKG